MNQPASPPGVVVDCMVFVQAAANEKGPAARILDLLDEGKITLYVSKLILAEARYVLNRPDVRARLHKLTDVAVEALFERLTQRAALIRNVPKRFVYPRDPKDESYINLRHRHLGMPPDPFPRCLCLPYALARSRIRNL